MGRILHAAGVFLFCISLASFGALPFLGTARPPRRIQVNAGETPLVLQAGGVEIVLDARASRVTRFAASEMQKFLSEILGEKIPVVHSVNDQKVSLILGINDEARKAGLPLDSLCRDAFLMRRLGNRIYIVGRDDSRADLARIVSDRAYGNTANLLHERGTLFGVYDFLERFCGVRFYHASPLFTIVPKASSLKIPQMDIYDRPDYEIRNYSIFYNRTDDDGKRSSWNPIVAFSPSKALNYCRFRGDTARVMCCHGLAGLYFTERFSKTHPEYFASFPNGQNGAAQAYRPPQLCFSRGAMEEIYQDARAILSGDPEKIKARSPLFYNKWGQFNGLWMHTPGKYFNFMPQDGYLHCQCEKCRKYGRDPQTLSNFVWGKTIELAQRLKKDGVGGYVVAMAYPPCRLLPENMVFPDNLLVMVAQNGPWDPPEIHRQNVEKVDLLNRMSRSGCKVWMWNYTCKASSRNLVLPGVPQGTPRAIGRYYHDMRDRIHGAYLESESGAMSDSYMMTVLDLYVFGRICWNNMADIDGILKEYYKLCYGGGAAEMEKLFTMTEDIWLKRIGGKTRMSNLGPVNIPPSDYELWNDIYNRKRLDEMAELYALAERKAAGNPKAVERIRYMKKILFDQLEKQHGEYLKRCDSIADFKLGLGPEHPARLWLQPLNHIGGPFPRTQVTVRDLGRQIEFQFDCEEPEMDSAGAGDRRRDDVNIWLDNEVEIFLNPSGDRIRYYQLMINSKGALLDAAARKIGAKSESDLSWDSRGKVTVREFYDGWQASLVLDKSIFPDWNPQGFAANFCRHRVVRSGEGIYAWSPFLKDGFHELERFGRLVPEKILRKNLVGDYDFSSDRMFWNGVKQGNGAVCHDDRCFIFGNRSLRLFRTGNEKDRHTGTGQRVADMKPNTRYRLTYYVKLENVVPLGKGAGAVVQLWNTDFNFWLPNTGLTGTIPWTRQAFEFTSRPGTKPKGNSIYCKLTNSSGTAWFDGIVLEELGSADATDKERTEK